jgi:hypothetical protein
MRVGEAWAMFVVVTLGPIAAGTASAETTPPADAPPAVAKAEVAKAEVEPPPRTPLPPEPPSVSLPWERHIEIGPDAIFVARPTSSQVHLQATAGFGAHLNWELLSHLRFTFYVEAARHPLTFDAGALGQPGKITSPAVSSYMFGARFSPTLPLTPRLRAWLTAGIGWGRFEYPRMTAQDPGQAAFMIPERSAYIVEVPLGLGIAFDIIPRWLSIQAELTGAFMVGHQGSAFEPGQAIDAAGKKRTIGTLPHLDASIVQSIGLSLLL